MPPPSPQAETGRRTRHRRCPPRLQRSFFFHDFAPPPPSFTRGPVKGGGVTIVAPMPVSLHLSRASGWLLHRHLSRRASASLVVPAPLSLRRGLSCGASPAPAGCRFANYLNVPPSLLSRRLVVALLPLSLRRCLSLRHLSHCAAVSLSHRPSQPQ